MEKWMHILHQQVEIVYFVRFNLDYWQTNLSEHSLSYYCNIKKSHRFNLFVISSKLVCHSQACLQFLIFPRLDANELVRWQNANLKAISRISTVINFSRCFGYYVKSANFFRRGFDLCPPPFAHYVVYEMESRSMLAFNIV